MRTTKSKRSVQLGAAALLLLLTAGASHAWWGGGPWNGYGYGPGIGVPYYGYPFNGYGRPPVPYSHDPALSAPPVPGSVPYLRPGGNRMQGATPGCGGTAGATENDHCPEADENAPARSSRSESPPAAGRYFCRRLNGIRRCWRY